MYSATIFVANLFRDVAFAVLAVCYAGRGDTAIEQSWSVRRWVLRSSMSPPRGVIIVLCASSSQFDGMDAKCPVSCNMFGDSCDCNDCAAPMWLVPDMPFAGPSNKGKCQQLVSPKRRIGGAGIGCLGFISNWVGW